MSFYVSGLSTLRSTEYVGRSTLVQRGTFGPKEAQVVESAQTKLREKVTQMKKTYVYTIELF